MISFHCFFHSKYIFLVPYSNQSCERLSKFFIRNVIELIKTVLYELRYKDNVYAIFGLLVPELSSTQNSITHRIIIIIYFPSDKKDLYLYRIIQNLFNQVLNIESLLTCHQQLCINNMVNNSQTNSFRNKITFPTLEL